MPKYPPEHDADRGERCTRAGSEVRVVCCERAAAVGSAEDTGAAA